MLVSGSSALIVALINFLKIYIPEKVSTKYISELAYECEVLQQGGSEENGSILNIKW